VGLVSFTIALRREPFSGSWPTPIGNLLKETVHYQECLPLSQEFFFNPSHLLAIANLSEGNKFDHLTSIIKQ
jgi:hypothetical protein